MINKIANSRYFFYIVYTHLFSLVMWVTSGLGEDDPMLFYQNKIEYLIVYCWIIYPISFRVYEFQKKNRCKDANQRDVLLSSEVETNTVKKWINNRYFFYIVGAHLFALAYWGVSGFSNVSPIDFYKNNILNLITLVCLGYLLIFYGYEQRKKRKVEK